MLGVVCAVLAALGVSLESLLADAVAFAEAVATETLEVLWDVWVAVSDIAVVVVAGEA